MKQLGSALLFFGGGSTLLYFLGYEFIVLSWIEAWGENIAWFIRGTMIVAGGLLLFLPTWMDANQAHGEAQSEDPHPYHG